MHEPIIEAERRRLGAKVHIVPLEKDVGLVDLDTCDIWISDALTLTERNCTLMHELGHIELGLHDTGDPAADAAIERAIDEWVASKLVPDALLIYALAMGQDEAHVCELLGVDELTLRARIRMETSGATILKFPAPRPRTESGEGEPGEGATDA